MCTRTIKLNFQGMETLFAELPPPEKQVIHLLVSCNDKGPEFTKLTAELVSIIAFLCKKLNWIEDVEDLDDEKNRKWTSEVHKKDSKEGILINRNVSDNTEDQENEINTSTTPDSDNNSDIFEDDFTKTEGEGEDIVKENCTEPDTVMKTREMTHKGLKPFSCSYCPKKFMTPKWYVSKHEKICCTKTFSCSYCEKKFTDMLKLSHHEGSHRDEKPFTCCTCGKNFTLASTLKRHEMSHLGKLFGCTMCDKKFSDKRHLKSHQRIHTGDLLSCNQCEKKFTRAEHLKRHENIHTRENVFLCAHCDKTFNRADKLKAHERQHTQLNMKPII